MNKKLLLTFFTFFFATSLRGKDGIPKTTQDLPRIQPETTYELDINRSHVNWKGYKGLGEYIKYSHHGRVSIKEGSVIYEGGHPKKINILMDMKTITCLDIKKPGRRQRLENHLKNEDFFAVSRFPIAQFQSSKIINKKSGIYLVTGVMTVRGIQNTITFELKVEKKDKQFAARANLTLDRTKWNVMYKSTKNIQGFDEKVKSTFETYKDRLIHDNFDLTILITTKDSKKNLL